MLKCSQFGDCGSGVCSVSIDSGPSVATMQGGHPLLLWLPVLCLHHLLNQHGSNWVHADLESRLTCKQGWKMLYKNCYFNQGSSVDWGKAQSTCEKTPGANLVSIGSQEEYMAVKNWTQSIWPNQAYWVGLKKTSTSWGWLDGGHFDNKITPWETGEPNNKGGKENCGETIDSGLLNDNECSAVTFFVCEMTTECSPGWYGQNCTKRCSVGCGTVCDRTDGRCQCKEGWNNHFCTECSPGWYGQNCTKRCSVDCDTVCDRTDGRCQCKEGWNNKFCTECSPGWYGQNCTKRCSVGCDTVCDGTDGRCQCKEGWNNHFCTGCADGLWGPLCVLPCGHCAGNGSCRMDTGLCLAMGCRTGWTGSRCSTFTGGSSDAPYVTLVVGVTACGLAALALLIMILRAFGCLPECTRPNHGNTEGCRSDNNATAGTGVNAYSDLPMQTRAFHVVEKEEEEDEYVTVE